MQKVLHRNLLRRNQRVKLARRENIKEVRKEWAQYDQGVVMRNRASRDALKEERRARREDWILGPLAPNRIAGLKQGVYGTINPMLTRGPELPKHEVIKKEKMLFALGDRAVVVRGASRGKIGKIRDIAEARGEVTIEGINIADIPLPPGSPMAKTSSEKFVSMELPIPLQDIRLVTTVVDDVSGTKKDIIIRHMYGGPPHIERPHGSILPTHTRYISGIDKEIAWPEDELKEFSFEPGDTMRREVEEITYVPTLIDPQIPEGVEDELRSKHKRGRGRYDFDWMKTQLEKDAREIWIAEKAKKLLTPQEEYAQRKQERREVEIETPEMAKLTERVIEERLANVRVKKTPSKIPLSQTS